MLSTSSDRKPKSTDLSNKKNEDKLVPELASLRAYPGPRFSHPSTLPSPENCLRPIHGHKMVATLVDDRISCVLNV